MAETEWTAHPVSSESAELGEGPRWDPLRQELLWVDILAGIVRRGEWRDGTLTTRTEYHVGRPVGAVSTVASGGLLVAAGTGLAWLDDDGTLTEFLDLEAASNGTVRMNDCVCDPQGRLWAGSMPYDTSRIGVGNLVRIDHDGSVHPILRDVTVSNGLAWNSAGTTMFYADSADTVVWQFDFDAGTGDVSNRRPFARLDSGVPDGICRDDEDHVWVTAHGAGRVHRFSPDGRLVATVVVPNVDNVSACAFGGADRSTLFITTATIGMTADEKLAQPDAGRVHAVRVDVSGPAPIPFAGSRTAR
jgi:sugar lactone lactonase YvrE